MGTNKILVDGFRILRLPTCHVWEHLKENQKSHPYCLITNQSCRVLRFLSFSLFRLMFVAYKSDEFPAFPPEEMDVAKPKEEAMGSTPHSEVKIGDLHF